MGGFSIAVISLGCSISASPNSLSAACLLVLCMRICLNGDAQENVPSQRLNCALSVSLDSVVWNRRLAQDLLCVSKKGVPLCRDLLLILFPPTSRVPTVASLVRGSQRRLAALRLRVLEPGLGCCIGQIKMCWNTIQRKTLANLLIPM